MASDKTENEPSHQAPSQVMTTAARAHLECTAGPEKGQKLRVAPNVTVLGRDAMCDVVLSESVISRQHARIERRGDQWILKNLSSNGTLLNRKPVDEAVLADHDEIRLGTATRLKFVVETVLLSSTGRPQFRRRVTAQEEAAVKEAAEGHTGDEAKPKNEFEQKSLLGRLGSLRLPLMLFSAGSLVFILVIGISWLRGGGSYTGSHVVPVLALEDMVYPGSGAPPLKIVGDRPEGVIGEDSLQNKVLVPRADIETGKAVIVPGIGKALDVKFTLEYNPAQAKECQRRAIELYNDRYLQGKIRYLFDSVRLFQQSMAYSGGKGYFEDPKIDRIYQLALDELTSSVDRNYKHAILLDKAGDYKAAYNAYNLVLELVPDFNNIIYVNVAWRLGQLKEQHSDLK